MAPPKTGRIQIVGSSSQTRGCMTCRARRVKCDGDGANPCNRCVKSGLVCEPSDGAPLSRPQRLALSKAADSQDSLSTAGIKRKRVAASCNFCRSRKQKCSGEIPTCARCRQAGRPCVYDKRRDADYEQQHESRDKRRSTPGAAFEDNEHRRQDDPTEDQAAVGDTSLPQKAELLSLVQTFFEEIAPLRCLGFIHEPSFLRELDHAEHSDDYVASLRAICALSTTTKAWIHLARRGSAWAREALDTITKNVQRMSVERVSCLVLLHEYFTRTDEPALSFMLSSMACRVCQALQLNVEYDLDFSCTSSSLTASEKEKRRRLMWSCYTMDSEASAGLDSLKLMRERNITIRLPSDDSSFAYGIARPATYLIPMGEYGKPTAANVDGAPLSIRACSVQLSAMRERVLRYLKRKSPEVMPFHADSDFTKLCRDLDEWSRLLPDKLRLTIETIYVRKKEGLLSALFDFHLQYNQIGCDLYRLLIPELLMPPRQQNTMTKGASAEYLDAGRRKWFGFACAMSDIFELALQHAPHSMKEPSSAITAYTAVRTKLYYLLHVLPEEAQHSYAPDINRQVERDLRYLRTLQSYQPITARLRLCAEEVVRTLDPRGGGTVVRSDDADASSYLPGQIDDTQLSQISADSSMHPLTKFRRLREKIASRHRPEAQNVGVSPFQESDWRNVVSPPTQLEDGTDGQEQPEPLPLHLDLEWLDTVAMNPFTV